MDYETYIVIYTFMDSRHIYIVEKEGLRAMNISWFEGLVKRRYEGLSIVILQAFTPYRQIVKAICRQIDKPYIPISPYHAYEGLSNPQKAREYKRYTNIPIDIQTISSGYKGLDNMLDIKV